MTETEEGSCNKDSGYINRIKKDANGNVTQTQEFTYNEDGSSELVKKDKDNRLKQYIEKDAKGNVTFNEERTYNDDGSRSIITKYYDNNKLKTIKENFYHKNGDLIKNTNKDAQGNVTESLNRTYNEDGSYKEVAEYYENGEVTKTEEAYYDKNGDSISKLK